jgi:hypothetical protein
MVLTNFTNGKTYCILSVWNNYKLRGNPHHGLGHLLVLSEAILVLLCFPQYKSQMISHSTSVRRPNCVQSFVVSPLVVYIYTYIMLYTSIMWWFLYDHLENWCLSLSVYSTSHMQIMFHMYMLYKSCYILTISRSGTQVTILFLNGYPLQFNG